VAGDSLILKATLGTPTAPQNYVRVRLTASTVVVETTVNGGGAFTAQGTLSSANANFANADVLTAQVDAAGLVSVWRTRGTTTVFAGSVQLPSVALWTTGGGRIGMSLPGSTRVDNFSGGTLP
jgi:hydroxymethylglutaryl-CoA reductase